MNRILGIDVGYARCGWGVIEKTKSKNSGMDLIDYGVIETDKEIEPAERLTYVFHSLNDLIKKFQPDEMAVEDLFFFKNQKTIISVGQVRGVILLCGELNGLKIFNYTPLEVKTSLTGYGRAEKSQIQNMVKLIFGLKDVPKPDDVADAIGIAVCHCNNFKYKLR